MSLPLRTLLGGTRQLSAPFPSARMHSARAICSGRKVKLLPSFHPFWGMKKPRLSRLTSGGVMAIMKI